ncbi:MAG: AbrB/MazE/SpoVT family DNA-binding domain-containing protein [Methylobacter tundripaludum]|jgi:AbrB family looped-hinge helix DNA binding protein|nr:AbrB/MazE/SpoVT family DNA-binding domain-containing protein [Methylobacter tundripaludum]
MISAKLSSKFQLAIPKAIRDQLDLKAGQQFTLIAKGDIIELVPVRSLTAARGSFKGCNPNGYRDHQDRI